MPKIAVVANIAWNLYNFRRSLVQTLLTEGHEVLLIASPDEYVERLEALGARFVPLKHLSRKGTNPWGDLRLYWELRDIYRREQPAMVLHYTIKPNIYGTLAANSAGLPSLASITGLGYTFLSNGVAARMARFLYRYALKKASAVIFQNQDDRNLFVSQGLITAPKTQLIAGSGIDTHRFSPHPKSEAHKNTFIFLFVGRLLYDKGIREFLQAAKATKVLAPEAQFWIVGALDQGNPSAINEAELQQYQDVIQYFGTTDHVAKFIADADVVVLPSYREGLPRVMLEALSMARPVITTDAPGCRETIQHEQNGFMIPPQNAQALAQAMQKMLALPPEARQIMGQKGRQMALDRFDQSTIIQQYLTLIDKHKKNV